MSTPRVYQTFDGYFVGAVSADPDPENPGKWLIPGGCVLMPPPAHDMATTRCRWDGTRWIPEPIPEPALEAPTPSADPVSRLAAFLAANPDIAALLPKE